MRTIIALILSLYLVGCVSWFKKEPPVITPQAVSLDQRVLEPCSGVDTEIDTSTFESLLVVHSDVLTMYVNCANKQAASIVLLKKFGNIK